MTDEQLNELTHRLRAMCPGYKSVDVVHLGRHRVRITCSLASRPGWSSTFLVNLDEDEESTKNWARLIAARLNRPMEVTLVTA